MVSIIRGAIVMVTVIALSSCANLFQGNFFENFDAPPDASEIMDSYVSSDGTVSTSKASDFTDAVTDAAESERFYDELSNNDRNELNAALKDVYENEAVDPETRQEASVLAAEVKIRGTGAGETINNVANVLTSDLEADAFNDPEALMDLIIPDSAKGDAKAIEKILNDLADAGEAYEYLGSTLTSDADMDGKLDGPDGVNMAETAQKAAVAIAVKNLTEMATNVTQLSEDIANGTLDPETYTNPVDSEDADIQDSVNSLKNILDAGGLGGLIEGL